MFVQGAGVLSVALALLGQSAPEAVPHPGLAAYVGRADATYAFKLLENHDTPAGTVLSVALTSQTWQGIPWTHQLHIYEPKEITNPDTALLFISGGSVGRMPKQSDHEMGFALARLCGARVAVLPQVPNQPLYDGKSEDDLISHTFIQYLESGDPDWPLLQPMAKSAVSAMTAVQSLMKERGTPVDHFIVTGASKRGWTTWLTGAMDPRVIGIAPMVIPTLNMKAQSEYQMASWGKYSEQIDDYVRKGLLQQFDTPRGRVLWKLVDPFTYLDRVKVPVLLINGANDRYWTVDSVRLFWDDIQSPHTLCLLPNAGHGLDENRDWALETLGAFFRSTAGEKPWPILNPQTTVADGKLSIEIPPQSIAPKARRLWVAASDTRDFRESPWKQIDAVDLTAEGAVYPSLTEHPLPKSGYEAASVELVYEIEGLTAHLWTPVVVLDKNGEITPESPPVAPAGAAVGQD